jgi:hypothetical protein
VITADGGKDEGIADRPVEAEPLDRASADQEAGLAVDDDDAGGEGVRGEVAPVSHRGGSVLARPGRAAPVGRAGIAVVAGRIVAAGAAILVGEIGVGRPAAGRQDGCGGEGEAPARRPGRAHSV